MEIILCAAAVLIVGAVAFSLWRIFSDPLSEIRNSQVELARHEEELRNLNGEISGCGQEVRTSTRLSDTLALATGQSADSPAAKVPGVKSLIQRMDLLIMAGDFHEAKRVFCDIRDGGHGIGDDDLSRLKALCEKIPKQEAPARGPDDGAADLGGLLNRLRFMIQEGSLQEARVLARGIRENWDIDDERQAEKFLEMLTALREDSDREERIRGLQEENSRCRRRIQELEGIENIAANASRYQKLGAAVYAKVYLQNPARLLSHQQLAFYLSQEAGACNTQSFETVCQIVLQHHDELMKPYDDLLRKSDL